MQNSGLGNAINPILSLADDEVYSIPLVMMIGWRGEPGVKDEPQHVKQGKVTQSMLKAMRIETYELDANSSIDVLKNACLSATKNSKPVAVLVKKNTFTDYQRKTNVDQSFEMSREDAIKIIAEKANKFNYSIVSTTGVASRERYKYNKQTHEMIF